MPIRTFLRRLLWASLAPMLVLAVVLSALRLQALYRAEHESAARVGANLAAQLEQFLQARLGALTTLARLAEAEAVPHGLYAEAYREAQAFRGVFGHHVLWVDAERQIVFNTRVPLGTALPLLPQPKGRSAWAIALHEGRPAIGDLVTGPAEQLPLLPVVAMAVPVRHEGQPVAGLIAVVELGELQALFDRWQLPSTATVTLQDGTGRTLAHRRAPGSVGSPAREQMLGPISQALPDSAWSLVVAVDDSAMRAAWWREVLQGLAALAVATLVAAYAARRAGRRLQRDIASLAEDGPHKAPTAGGESASGPADASPLDPRPMPDIREIGQVRQRLYTLASEHAAALAAARDSEARVLSLLSAFRRPVWISIDHRIVFANLAAQRLLGVDEARMIGRTALEFLEPAQVPRVQSLLARVRAGEVDVVFDNLVFPLAGPTAHTLLVSSASIEHGGRQANLTVARDITELVQTRHALERSNRELLRLVGRLNTVEEEERRRIARDLHDDLQQRLGVVAMEQERAAAALPLQAAEAGAALQAARSGTGAAIDSVRRIVHALRPQALDELGLAAALEVLVRDFGSHTGLQVEFERIGAEEADAALPGPVSSCLYRIAQEALTNVHKHARASFVHLGLDLSSPGHATLFVTDDGRGIQPSTREAPEAYGLLGMKERVHALGGTLEVGPAPDGGTRVQATLGWRPTAGMPAAG